MRYDFTFMLITFYDSSQYWKKRLRYVREDYAGVDLENLISGRLYLCDLLNQKVGSFIAAYRNYS